MADDDLNKGLDEAVGNLDRMASALKNEAVMINLIVKGDKDINKALAFRAQMRGKEARELKNIRNQNKARFDTLMKYGRSAEKVMNAEIKAAKKKLGIEDLSRKRALGANQKLWDIAVKSGNAAQKKSALEIKGAVAGKAYEASTKNVLGYTKQIYTALNTEGGAVGAAAAAAGGLGNVVGRAAWGLSGGGVPGGPAVNAFKGAGGLLGKLGGLPPQAIAGIAIGAAIVGFQLIKGAASLEQLSTRVDAARIATSGFGVGAKDLSKTAYGWKHAMSSAADKNRMQGKDVEELSKYIGSNVSVSMSRFTDANNKAGLSLQNIKRFSSAYGVNLDESAQALVLGRDIYRRKYKGEQADIAATRDLTRTKYYANYLQKQGYGAQGYFIGAVKDTVAQMQDTNVSFEDVARTMTQFMTAGNGVAATRTQAASATQRLGSAFEGMGMGMQMLMTGGGIGGAAKWTKASLGERAAMTKNSGIGRMISGMMAQGDTGQGMGMAMGGMFGLSQRDLLRFFGPSGAPAGLAAGGEGALGKEIDNMTESMTDVLGDSQKTFQSLNETLELLRKWLINNQ